MSEATVAPVPVPDDVSALTNGYPTWERLSTEAALQPCDGHASKAVTALVTMTLPSGGTVELCGNCARKAGWEHTATAPAENKTKGSAN